MGVRWQCVGIIYLLPILLGLNSGHQAWQHVSYLFTEPLPDHIWLFNMRSGSWTQVDKLSRQALSVTEPPCWPKSIVDSSPRSMWGGADAVTWLEVLLRHQAYGTQTRESLVIFFGHKIVSFNYKNSACADGNVGEHRVEFIVLCLNYFLPPLCCFFISTTGGRLLGDLLCENVGR